LPKNVHSLIQDLKDGLADLQAHFEHLGSVFGGNEKTSAGGRKRPEPRAKNAGRNRRGAVGASAASSPAKPKRKKPNLSPAVRAQRKLQGQYMAKFKTLPKTKQAQVRKVRAEKGYPAALKMMG
jgi:hypothetical protein